MPSRISKHLALSIVIAGAGLGIGSRPRGIVFAAMRHAPAREMPQFEVDASWPRMPNEWVLGQVSGVNVDGQDHVWILHRPRTVGPAQKASAAPPVLEFDAAGNLIQAWGGPGDGYEWPATEHGISIDEKGFVWIGGSSTGGNGTPGDDQILKFTRARKFVMQIGRRGHSKGNADRVNVHGSADVTPYPPTNEIFVADGYGNRRVIVFDANTGAFKRMWGAFGDTPTDPLPSDAEEPASTRAGGDNARGASQFNQVHCVRIAKDGLVYVCDRANKRVQVFTVDGRFVQQVFLSREVLPPSTLPGMAFGKPIRELADAAARAGMSAARIAFSADPQQRFLYVADRSRQQIAIFERKTLDLLGFFGGGPGAAPGQFYVLHDLAADSKGNLYTAEVNEGRRAQKFSFRGLAAF